MTRAMRSEENAQAMTEELRPIIASATQIAQDFKALKGDLKVEAESSKAILEAVEAIKLLVRRTSCDSSI